MIYPIFRESVSDSNHSGGRIYQGINVCEVKIIRRTSHHHSVQKQTITRWGVSEHSPTTSCTAIHLHDYSKLYDILFYNHFYSFIHSYSNQLIQVQGGGWPEPIQLRTAMQVPTLDRVLSLRREHSHTHTHTYSDWD